MRLLFTFFILTTIMLNAQGLQGKYTVGPGKNYASLKAAAAAVNSTPLTGDVILELSSDYNDASETFPIKFNQFTSTGGEWKITICPAADARGLVINATNDVVIMLDGADRITVDGRPDGQGNASELLLRGNTLEAIELKNGATNNLFTYLTLETKAEWSAIVSIASTTNSTGNSFNTISNCMLRQNTLTNTSTSYAWISSFGNNNARNSDNKILYNLFQNIKSTGINVGPTGIGDNWEIIGNSFYWSHPTAIAKESQSAIIFNGGYYSNNNTISNNYIGGSEPFCAGDYWVNESNGDFYGLNVIAGSSGTNLIQNNVITNIHLKDTLGDLPVIPIKVGEGSYIVSNNLVGSASKNNSIKVDSKSNIIGIMLITTNLGGESNAKAEVYNNTIAGIEHGLKDRGSLTGIRIGCDKDVELYRNKIFNLISNGPAGNYAFVAGIDIWGFNSPKTYNIYNNMLTLGEGVTGQSEYYGIYNHAYTANQINILYNSIVLTGTLQDSYIDAVYFHEAHDGINSSTTLKNNILIDTRDVSFAITLFRTAATDNLVSDYNFFSTYNMDWVFSSAGTKDFNQWKALNKDNNSYYNHVFNVNLDSLFVNYKIGNLSIKETTQEAWFVFGKGTPLMNYKSDFSENDIRSDKIVEGMTTIGADEISPTSTPQYAKENMDPAIGDTSFYSVYGNTVASIVWDSTGTVPDSINLRFYSGRKAPGTESVYHSNMYWEVSPANGSGYEYDITFHYDETMLGSIQLEENIVVAKSNDNGLSWNTFLNPGTGEEKYLLDTANNTVTIHGLKSFSLFTLVDKSSPLSVHIDAAPESYMLMQNYPNPFNPSTTIRFAVPQSGMVKLNVYDALGNLAAEVVNESKSTGTYEVNFNGSNLSSGVYFYKLEAGEFRAVKKFILMK